MEALARLTDLFEYLSPYQQKQLMRLVLHKAVLSHGRMELASYGKPPELSELPQEVACSETSDCLSGRNLTLRIMARRSANDAASR
jgi:hypothetical protein